MVILVLSPESSSGPGRIESEETNCRPVVYCIPGSRAFPKSRIVRPYAAIQLSISHGYQSQKWPHPTGTTAIWILRQPHKQGTGKQLTTHTKKAERRQDIPTRVQPLFQPKPHSAAEPSPLHFSFYLFPSTRTPWLIFRGRGRGSVLRG